MRQENSYIAKKLSSIYISNANVTQLEKYHPEKDAWAVFRKKLKSIIAHTDLEPEKGTHTKKNLEFTLEDI